MYWLDIVILLPIAYGVIRGLMRGFVQELTGIVVIIFGIIAARLWAPALSLLVMKMATMPEWGAQTVAYVLIFLAVGLCCKLAAMLVSRLLHAICLGWLNRLAGGLFGGLKWAIVVIILLYATTLIDPYYQIIGDDTRQTSIAYPHIQKASALLSVTWKQFGE